MAVVSALVILLVPVARVLFYICVKFYKRTNANQGMASLCIGGGQGGAVLIKNEAPKNTNNNTKNNLSESLRQPNVRFCNSGYNAHTLESRT